MVLEQKSKADTFGQLVDWLVDMLLLDRSLIDQIITSVTFIRGCVSIKAFYPSLKHQLMF